MERIEFTMLENIKRASEVLKEVAVQTPILVARGLFPGSKVYLKAENLQRTGSFKLRGAYYKISRLSPEEKKRGVIACSAGNHAQGVALAAEKEGIKCVICMPEGAPISKIQRTQSYGAEVILVPGVFDDALVHALKLAEKSGHVFIHPFDDEDIIAGQGTIGLEIMEQMPDVDIILVPVGGGGLISGVAAAVKAINPKCQVYGVEAQNASCMKNSIEYNELVKLETAYTIADGIAVRTPGQKTLAYCRRYVDGFITVNESQITLAILKLLEEYKLLVEGAGAAAVAAAMYGKLDILGKKVVCIASGGNVDVNILERIITKGLKHTGRVIEFTTTMRDKPGELLTISKVLADHGANVLSFRHDRSDIRVDMDHCVSHISFEARNREHQIEVIKALEAAGYYIDQKQN